MHIAKYCPGIYVEEEEESYEYIPGLQVTLP
jgi:hypothetical protein